MTLDQENKRLRDLLTWVEEHARCLETRRFVARGLRLIEEEKNGATFTKTFLAGDRRQ